MASLAEKVRNESTFLEEINNLKIYKPPLKIIHKDSTKKHRRLELGAENVDKDHHHMLVTGMTGSGKSLLINTMVNYIYGVNFEDDFRFKLIVNSDEIKDRGAGAGSDESTSMTSWVNCYTFYWEKGFRIPYNLTIIDTPGFGDTRGLDFDEQIVTQLREFFDDSKACQTNSLSCINLVIQGSQARLTDEQRYIFGQVLNIFGKDMEKNIFISFTYSNRSEPAALQTIKSGDVPFLEKNVFKFDNYYIYDENDEDGKSVWTFAFKNLTASFEALKTNEHVDLKKTKKVLHDREKLQLILKSLEGNISKGMDMLTNIENLVKTILNLDDTIDSNRDTKVEIITYPQTITPTAHGQQITNCKPCQFTCHDPCGIVGDVKQGCAAMDDSGNSFFCPKKCSWKEHTNGTQTYSYEKKVEEKTLDETLKKYEDAIGDKNSKVDTLNKLLEEYGALQNGLFKSIADANTCSIQLEENSLRSSYLKNVDYIDRLIYLEEQSSTLNKQSRLDQLRQMKKMAQILQDAKGDEKVLTKSIKDYEDNVRKQIDLIKEKAEQKETVRHEEAPDPTKGAGVNPGAP